MIKIVKSKLTDEVVNELIELSKAWEQEDITYGYHSNQRSDLNEPCFLALDDHKVVGYVFGHYYDNEKIIADIKVGDHCFMIDEIYVIKEYRSQGIGKRLFEAMEKEVKDNCLYITLPTSTKDWERILHFYNKEAGLTFHSAFLFKKTDK